MAISIKTSSQIGSAPRLSDIGRKKGRVNSIILIWSMKQPKNNKIKTIAIIAWTSV